MPFLPLKEKPFRNVDSASNSSAIEYFVDILKNDYMDNETRHGLGGDSSNALVDLGTGSGIDGLFYPKNLDTVVAAFSGGKLFKVASNGTKTEITGATLNTGTPVQFADFGDIGFFCNNSKIIKWQYSLNTCSYLTDAQAPTNATHLGFIDSYLVALKSGSQRFDWAEVDDPDTWLGEFASAESRPDDAVALISAFGELFIPGKSTIEYWSDSGDLSAPFQRIPGTTAERGVIAPYSVTQVDNSFFFLDEERRVIRMAGRSPQVIGNSYDKDFQALDVVEDAIGMHVNAEGSTLWVITFPTEGRCFYYDYKLDYWGEFSNYNSATGIRENWLGNCGVYAQSWNKYLVGSRSDGKIYIMSKSYVADDSNIKVPELWTGNINWGTDNRKESQKLRVKLKRGATTDLTANPNLLVSYRDDGDTTWSNEKILELGITGDTEFFSGTFLQLGNYRTRQWRIRILDAGPTTIVSAEETVNIIG